MRSALLQVFPISIGPGNLTQNLDLDLLNLTWCKSVTLEMILTAVATDAVDLLDVKFQETRSPTRAYYDTRGRFKTVLGNTGGVSAATPYADQLTISQDIDLTSPEKNETPTGSVTGVELPAGTVRNGPMAPIIRTALGKVSTHRLVVATSGDVNSNAAFTGTVSLWGHAWDTS